MKTKKLEIVFAAKFERELQRNRSISRNIRYLESAIQHLRLQGELATSRENMRRSFQEMMAFQDFIKRCGE